MPRKKTKVSDIQTKSKFTAVVEDKKKAKKIPLHIGDNNKTIIFIREDEDPEQARAYFLSRLDPYNPARQQIKQEKGKKRSKKVEQEESIDDIVLDDFPDTEIDKKEAIRIKQKIAKAEQYKNKKRNSQQRDVFSAFNFGNK